MSTTSGVLATGAAVQVVDLAQPVHPAIPTSPNHPGYKHSLLRRHGDAVRVQYALNGGVWRMARLAPFADGPARAGIMACSPERGGFRVRFEGVTIGPPIARALHE